MTPNPRPFRYAFRALMARQQWSLERCQRELAEAAAHGAEARRALDALHRQVDGVRAALGASHAVIDPVWRRASLSYLGHLQGQVHHQEAACRRADNRCDEARRACLAEQQRLDAFEQHRQRCRRAHEQAAAQALAARIDDDWAARMAPHGLPRETSPTPSAAPRGAAPPSPAAKETR